MKLVSINIDGFGIFHDVSINGLDSTPLLVFNGCNEAGKSTLLGFIRTVLFGFPHANSRNPNYPPLAGGVHGGRIRLITDDGTFFTVGRKPGRKAAGILTANSEYGKSGGVDLLQDIMGGVTFDVFKNIYAFSLSELQTFETLKPENVKNVIYSASAGTAVLALPTAEKQFNDRLAQLFKPRGSKQLINRKIAEYEKVRSELNQAKQGQAEFDHFYRNLQRTKDDIQKFQRELAQTTREKQKYKSYRQLWPEWMTIQENEKAIANLPETVESFPEDGIPRLGSALENLESYRASFAEIQNELKQLYVDLEPLTVNQPIIDHSAAISYLLEQRSTYTESRHALSARSQALKECNTTIRRLLENLGNDWAENDVQTMDRSLFTRESIRKFEDRLNTQNNERTTAETLLKEKKINFERSVHETKLAEQMVVQSGKPESETDRFIVQELQNGRNEFARIVSDLDRYQTRLRDKNDELIKIVREIDPGWTEADVKKFDTSLSAKEKVTAFISSFNSAQQERRDAKIRFKTSERSVLIAREKHHILISNLNEAPKPPVSSHDELDRQKYSIQLLQKYIFRSRELNRDNKHREERLSDKQHELSRISQSDENSVIVKLLVWVSFVVVLFGLLTFIASRKWIEFGLLIGISLVLTATLIVLYKRLYRVRDGLSRPNSSMRDSLQEQIGILKKTIRANCDALTTLESEIAALEKELELPSGVTLDDLSSRENRLENERRLLHQYTQLDKDASKQAAEVKRREDELNNAQEMFNEAEATYAKLETEWKQHLREINLDQRLTPSSVMDTFGKVEAVGQQLIIVNSLKQDIGEMENIRDEYLDVVTKVPDLTHALEKPPSKLLTEVDTFISRLQEQQKSQEKYHRATLGLEEKEKQRVVFQKEYQVAKEEHRTLVEATRELQGEWVSWLQQNKLQFDLSPKTAIDALDCISECAERINQRGQLEAEIGRLNHIIDRYEEGVFEVFNQLNRAVPETDKIIVAVSELVDDLETTRGNLREKIQIQHQIKKNEAKRAAVESQINQCQQRIHRLLTDGHSSNEEQFRQRGAQCLTKTASLAEIDHAKKNIRRLSGESDFSIIRRSLERLSLEKIQAHENESSLKEQEIAQKLDELRNTRADLNHRMAKLKSADDIARLRADEERLLEEIRELALEWSQYAMAGFLIEKTKARFEKEQQPKVIQDATVFFRQITHSRYAQLLAPIGGDTIEVVTTRNERRKPEELSRGTMEQLYLSLRFGYIRNRAQNSESLPVIMDDILVNFDPIRAQNAVTAILELSKKHQVFFFTCHPETAKMFKACANNVAIYEINDGAILQRR